jgi:hypothetical protein
MFHVLTLHVTGPFTQFAVSVPSRCPAEFQASFDILQREGRPAAYLVVLTGEGVPKLMADGIDAIEAALRLGYGVAHYLEGIDEDIKNKIGRGLFRFSTPSSVESEQSSEA